MKMLKLKKINNNEEKEQQRRIKLEIRLRFALLGLISVAGGLGLFIIKRILDLIIK